MTQFVAETAAVNTPKPPNMHRLVELNRGPHVGAPAPVDELPVALDGARVLDVRPLDDFLAGHAPGAISVPVDGSSFGTKAGFVLDADDRIVVAAASADEAERAIRGLRAIGLLDLVGYVLGGGSERMDPVSLEELAALLEAGADLIDVRERDERDTGYIAGSRNIPYRLLALGSAEIAAGRPIVTICESGARAGIAASLLAGRGLDARPVLDGGVAELVCPGRPDG